MKKEKWFCLCGCKRLVKSCAANCSIYQPVVFARSRMRLGQPRKCKLEDGYERHCDAPPEKQRFKLFGFYCPACCRYFGKSFCLIQKEKAMLQNHEAIDEAVRDYQAESGFIPATGYFSRRR